MRYCCIWSGFYSATEVTGSPLICAELRDVLFFRVDDIPTVLKFVHEPVLIVQACSDLCKSLVHEAVSIVQTNNKEKEKKSNSF